MSGKEIPAMPDPANPPKGDIRDPSNHRSTEVENTQANKIVEHIRNAADVNHKTLQEEQPVRLELNTKNTTFAHTAQQRPGASVANTSTKPGLHKAVHDHLSPTQPAELSTPQPLTAEPARTNTPLSHFALFRSRKWMIPIAAFVLLSITAMVVWMTKNKQGDNNATSQARTHARSSETGPIKQQTWEADARTVLTHYLEADSARDHDECLRLVTNTKETLALLPNHKPKYNPADVVEASSFVAKPLPNSFTDHGIYLMYYQRPDTLPNDAVFSPLIPLRVKLSIDSPSFLEASAKNGYFHERNNQNICAFFKRGKDNRLTLDWPVFAQTRYRTLANFTNHPHIQARQVFRLLLNKTPATLVENVYDQHLANHDWYRIHCPGYDKETHIVAVDKKSDTGIVMSRHFDSAAKAGIGILAATAELSWRASDKDGNPILCISGIVCWEFLGLNSPDSEGR